MNKPRWTVEINDKYQPPHVLRYHPEQDETVGPDGSKRIKTSFPCLRFTEWVAGPARAAEELANTLNRVERLEQDVVLLMRVLEPFAALASCYANGAVPDILKTESGQIVVVHTKPDGTEEKRFLTKSAFNAAITAIAVCSGAHRE